MNLKVLIKDMEINEIIGSTDVDVTGIAYDSRKVKAGDVFVATKGEIVYGTSLLFVYALGHCALIFLAGTATGFVESFIKSKGISNLTIWGKRLGGLIVVLVGIYMFYLGITL